uniref:Lysosomal cobalamin transporter n=1 Tax=Syphacia muris TaxID=451379 RepID=A0A0N5AHY1_9BILA
MSIVGLIAAIRTEQPIFLWPFLITQFLVLISLLLLTLISYVVVIFPSSDYWSLFVSDDEKDGPKINVRLKALLACILYGIGDTYEIWIISVGLACHRYFDDMIEQKEERLRKSRNRLPQPIAKKPKLPEVRTQLPYTAAAGAGGQTNFTNPAFVIEDSDDERDSPPFPQNSGKRQIT